MAERAALDVLARQPDRRAVFEDGRERQLLGRRPVDRAFGGGGEHLPAPLAAAIELPVHREALGHGQEALVQRLQAAERDGRLRLSGRSRRGNLGRRLDEALLGIERVVHALHAVEPEVRERLRAPALDDAARFERPRPEIAHGRVLADLAIQHRLRERRLVALVVAVAPVADEIDQHVAAELHAVRERQPRGRHTRLRIVGVHVHDRNLEAAREAARVERAGRVRRIGREPDLIVRDDVDRAAGRVAVEPVKIQRLGHDALAGERRVAVDEDRQHRIRIEGRRPGLGRIGARRARHALEHGIDRLEMARVRRHRNHELDAFSAGNGPRRAKVVLDVAAPLNAFVAELTADRILELREDLVVGLAEHVRHHVQAPAMRHADERLPDAGLGRLGNHLVEDRHEHVEPLDREPRLARERAVQEPLERLDVRQPVEQRNRIDRIGRRAIPSRLDRLAQPLPFLRNEDVRDVVARRRTVNRPQPLDDVPHRVCAFGHGTIEQRRRKRAKVGFSDAVRFRPKRGIAHRPAAKRIDFGREVAVTPNRLRQVDGADHEVGRGGTRATCRRRFGSPAASVVPIDAGGGTRSKNARVSRRPTPDWRGSDRKARGLRRR